MPLLFQVVFYEITRISYLSFEELVAIAASFHNTGKKEVNYSRYTPEQIRDMVANERFSPVKTIGLLFTKHFRNFPCENYDYYLSLYSAYNNHGVLPFAGGWGDQPAFIVDVLDTLKALNGEAQLKAQKKQGNKGNVSR